mgnify:CR=1 FL=1
MSNVNKLQSVGKHSLLLSCNTLLALLEVFYGVRCLYVATYLAF